MMCWRKLGRIFASGADLWWSRSHTIFPVPEIVDDAFLRVYYTALDENQYGRGGYFDLDIDDPTRVLRIGPEPILDIGQPGDFDDTGANPFSVVTFKGRKLMFYQGWQKSVRSPFAIFTGLAVAETGDDTNFRKIGHTPVLDRIENERYIRGAPFVLVEGDVLKMWYVASNVWQERDGQLHYKIETCYATSNDGVQWSAETCSGLGPQTEDEYAVGRPTIWEEGGLYRMCYSVRSFSKPYALGYAESPDGRTWTRKDHEVGLLRSTEGWDSEMICYPHVQKIGSRFLMFYNGNGHGRSGIGCAELVP